MRVKVKVQPATAPPVSESKKFSQSPFIMRLLLATCFLAALFQNTWAQNNSTTAPPTTNTTSSNGNTTAGIDASTFTPSSNTTTNGSSSTSTANITVTPSPAAPDTTINGTTAASPNATDSNSTSTPTTTTATTTVVTTTGKSPVWFDFNSDTAVFTLNLTVSPNSSADIMYHNVNLTRHQLLANISQYFQQLCVIDLSNKSEESGSYRLLLKFFFSQIYGINSTLEEEIRNATIRLNETQAELKVSSYTLDKISDFFQNISANPCLASNVCPVGSTCQVKGCYWPITCGSDTCNGHGQCVISISQYSALESTPKCICNENYDTEYYGDYCESSRTGKLQIIAIIAGVLGATILVLFLIIIIICITQRRKGSGYEISKGHKNKAYDGEVSS